MAVITLGVNQFNATATTQSKARGLFGVKSNPAGSATIQANTPRLLVTVKASVGGSATETSNQFVVRKYVKTSVQSNAQTVADAKKFKTFKASLSAGATVSAYWTDRDIKKSMSDYIPKYYDEIREAAAIIRTEANEVTRIKANLTRVFDQFFVNSSDVTLDRWENLLGIKNADGKSVEARRQYINARLRGAGTTTPDVLSSVVTSFYKAEFKEIANENRFEIKLTGIRGEPDNLVDIRDAINDIIPAHIEPTFIFSYLPYSEISQAELTWGQADTYTYYELERAFLIKEES